MRIFNNRNQMMALMFGGILFPIFYCSSALSMGRVGPYVECEDMSAGDYTFWINCNVKDRTSASSPLSAQWAKISGPGDVNFHTPERVKTLVDVTRDGEYVLELSVTDEGNSTKDKITVIVNH